MEAIITLNCSKYSKNIIDILKAFKKIGWDIYNSKGEVEYLPLGDGDMYAWTWEKMSEANFQSIMSEKIANNEQVGVNLYYNNGVEGISFLAHNTDEIVLSLLINRRLIDNRHTDMVWYLENIIYKFMDIGIELLAYSVKEYED